MKDNFSAQAAEYAKFRPVYPQALYDFILTYTKGRNQAWDVGAGNGQTATQLAAHFDHVTATDISQNQLAQAGAQHNISYLVEPAEQSSLPGASVDLVTISQALHWFNFDEFYKEVKRVAAPGAVIAAWTYNLLSINPEIDALIHSFHFETLDKYWDEERKFVDDGYANIPFPFTVIPAPDFTIHACWHFEELQGYLGTWSAVQKYRRETGDDPVAPLMQNIRRHWREGEKLELQFPVYLKMGLIQ
ncbi:MAG: SAM-dependent methyltransferase [Ferruginibacter sp.]|nr:SAM-dependent methyltransferase [Ferruginibacter sp.]